MNKKMTKSLPAITLLLALILALMTVLTVLKTDNGDEIMNGLKAVFGGNVASVGGFASVDVNFSFLNFLAFFLPLLLTGGLFFSQRKKSDLKTALSVLVVAAFVFSFIILINLGTYTKGSAEAFGGTVTYTYESAKLAIGSLVALVISALGIISSLTYTLTQFK